MLFAGKMHFVGKQNLGCDATHGEDGALHGANKRYI